MNKITLITLFLAVALISSCKEEEPTVESQLVGVWTGDEFHVNGDLSQFNDLFKAFKLSFEQGGTGVENSFGTIPFAWTYDDTSKKLTITKEEVDLGGITYDLVIVADITKLDETNLWFSYSDSVGDVIEERYLKSN